MITFDKKYVSTVYQQAITDRIRSFNNGTFPCVSVDVYMVMLDNYESIV